MEGKITEFQGQPEYDVYKALHQLLSLCASFVKYQALY